MEIIEKTDSTTNYDYGYKPEERPIEKYLTQGVINLDKPSGPTSHEVDSWVKHILETKKTGHSGTLDPKVTGILPIGTGMGTRVIQLLLLYPKEYVCLMKLHKKMPQEEVEEKFNEFTGKIFQIPPVKSAVKRELRVRTVYYSDIHEITDDEVLFRIGCQSGTYVRTYCHHIGEALGCGAHMEELRRTKVGPFNEQTKLTTLQDLTDAYYYYKHEDNESYIRNIISPMEEIVKGLPKIYIKDSTVGSICHGANLAAGGIAKFTDNIKYDSTVALMTLKGEIVASGKALHNSQALKDMESGICVNVDNVYMERDIYPIMWK